MAVERRNGGLFDSCKCLICQLQATQSRRNPSEAEWIKTRMGIDTRNEIFRSFISQITYNYECSQMRDNTYNKIQNSRRLTLDKC